MGKMSKPVTAKSILSKEELYILFGLGKCYKSFNKMFSDRPLKVSISKVVFIDIMISSRSVRKKERALYKNLESLEKKKFLKYKENELSFTKKGLVTFTRIEKEVDDFNSFSEHLNDPKTISLHKKLQTRLKH